MELPPTIQIAFNEKLCEATAPSQLADVVRSVGLGPELTRQAEWTEKHFAYGTVAQADNPVGFMVAPSSSLNPFSPLGKCRHLPCLIRSTQEFIRTVGIYADVAFLPDPLSPLFSAPGSLDDNRLASVHTALRILGQLEPLVHAGVVRFVSPYHHYCRSCFAKLTGRLNEAAESLLADIAYDIKADVFSDRRTLFVGMQIPLFYPAPDHPLITELELRGKQKATFLKLCGSRPKARLSAPARKFLAELIRGMLRDELRNVLYDTETASSFNSLMLAASRIEPLFLAYMDGVSPPRGEIESWERLRTVQLPWIHELSANEVLRLRSEASLALPRLRELLAKRLGGEGISAREVTRNTIAELRDQVIEVEAELNGLDLVGHRFYQLGMAALAVAFVIYGLSSGAAPLQASSVAAMLATLAHLHSAEEKQKSIASKVSAQPAFALLKAREIAASRRRH